MNIKLANGTEINLNDLDKLENKSVDNLGKYFDKENAEGKPNNVFDKEEIEKLKEFLLEVAGSDGIIDEQEMSQIPVKYKSIFEGYNSSQFADDLNMLSFTIKKAVLENSMEIERKTVINEAKQEAEKQSSTMYDQYMQTIKDFSTEKKPIVNQYEEPLQTRYKVRSGDTVSKIVASLGYKGNEAKIYAAALTQQLEQDGSFMNAKKWLMSGSTIRLLDKATLNHLGLSVPSNNTENPETQPISNAPPPETSDKSPFPKNRRLQMLLITQLQTQMVFF